MVVDEKQTAVPPQPGQPRSDISASPWAGFRNHFLESLDALDQVRIFDLSVRIAQTLHRWAARYPLIRRVRVWPLALSVAAAARFSDVEALASTARVSLWVFTVDDLFDEERVPQAELMRRAERYRAIVRQQPVAPAHDSLAAALGEVRDDLARYPLFDALGHEWAAALCATMDGMILEHDWRLRYRRDGAATLPSYEDYVANGLYSIGGPPHIWSALITTGDRSTPGALDHLRPMEQTASACIRLANDLQSHSKEVAEGKINGLVILNHTFRAAGVPADDALRLAEARVRADIAHGLDCLASLQADAHTQTGRPEAAIADIARFVCDFYAHYDYHTFAGTVSPMLGKDRADRVGSVG